VLFFAATIPLAGLLIDRFGRRRTSAGARTPLRGCEFGVPAVPAWAVAGRFNLFATTGFLPAEFRTLMRLPWTNSQQRRFEWLLTCLRGADRVIPHGLWVFGYRLYLQTCGAQNGSSRKVRTS
jgi:uncharacterized protein (DUF2236 family)